jgi:hypothetical protein
MLHWSTKFCNVCIVTFLLHFLVLFYIFDDFYTFISFLCHFFLCVSFIPFLFLFFSLWTLECLLPVLFHSRFSCFTIPFLSPIFLYLFSFFFIYYLLSTFCLSVSLFLSLLVRRPCLFVCLFVCFPGVTTHRGCIFHIPVAGFSLLVFGVSWSHTTTRHSR